MVPHSGRVGVVKYSFVVFMRRFAFCVEMKRGASNDITCESVKLVVFIAAEEVTAAGFSVIRGALTPRAPGYEKRSWCNASQRR